LKSNRSKSIDKLTDDEVDMIDSEVGRILNTRKDNAKPIRNKRTKTSEVGETSSISGVSRGSRRSRSSGRRIEQKREKKLKEKKKRGDKGIDARDLQPIKEEVESEISESEAEKLEKELLLSKSDLSKESDVSIPVEIIDGPHTRSMTKEYIHRIHHEKYNAKEGNRSPRIKLKNRGRDQPSEDESSPERQASLFYSPFREKIMTPMRAFARGIQSSVSKIPLLSKQRKSHIDYEKVNNAF